MKRVCPIAHANQPANRPKWAIPLHIIDKPGKPGQLRICHDCRAKVGGVCLNDMLLEGPALACSIVGVILRFRDGGEVAVGADIKGFFHDVYVAEEDAGAYRYWWFQDERMQEVHLNEFWGNVMGAKCSPCASTYVLRHHVRKHEVEYGPEVVEAVERDFYVDDLCRSMRGVDEARGFCPRLTSALADGGFTLCKWRSTHPEALADLPAGAVRPTPEGGDASFPSASLEEVVEKILGLCYDFSSDVFFFRPDRVRLGQRVTNKREMLRVIASLYDPMGFLAPFVIKARIIFQRAVRAVKGWDDVLPQDIIAEFEAWQRGLPEVEGFRIPRWTSTLECCEGSAELHCFADASAKAHGVSLYRVTVAPGGARHSALVRAIARVTPLKDAEAGHHDSVPRLEIQAARLAAEVAAEVGREVGAGKYGRVVFWVDSECVLKQLHDSRTRFKMYFANRISIILGLSKVQQWRKVPTELNPADDCSRGLEPSDPKWRRFHQGPEFLWKDEAEWPPQVVLTQPLSAAVMAVVATPLPVGLAPLAAPHWALRVAASSRSGRSSCVASLLSCVLLGGWCRVGGQGRVAARGRRRCRGAFLCWI